MSNDPRDREDDDWSSTDHLEPLPDPTPHNLFWISISGLVIGAAAVLIDFWVTQTLLGFVYPYVIFAIAFISIFAITGACRDNSLPMVLTFLTAIVVGVLGTNTLRVVAADRASVLAGIGL